MKINTPLINWSINDLELLRDDPYNIEDMNIEYKVQYSGDPDELRKDIISFANSETGGYILYGIRDDPFELVGIPRKQVDKLKNTLDSIINTRIDPHLNPPPIAHPICLSNDIYILGVQIFPKEKGLYAIRKVNNPNSPDFRCYSFWTRTDGQKRQLSMEEVNTYIIQTDPYKKYLEVSVNFGLLGRQREVEEYICVEGVNKSIRPITITSYGLQIFDEKDNKWFNFFLPVPNYKYPTTIFNTPPNTKLLDGDKCSGFYPISLLKEDLLKFNILVPTKIKGLVNTNDGPFYSREIELREDLLEN